VLALTEHILAQSETLTREYWPTDDWRTRSPEELGLDITKLHAIDPFVKDSLAATTSILVVRHGYLAFESYYAGDKDSPRRLWSATKSVTSILTGILIKSHQIQSIDDFMLSYLPELRSGNLAPNVDKITIRNLLTMTSGFPPDPLGTLFVKGLLSKPLDSLPGETFAYNSTNADLLSIIITELTKQTAAEFAETNLFKPLGIRNYSWAKEYLYSNGGLGLSLSSRDMAKIGYLYLNKGTWDKTEIVAQDWVSESTSVQVSTTRPLEAWKNYGYSNYGFLWWISGFKGAYFAFGAYGQSITVMPDQDMVVVITAETPMVGSGEDAGKYFAIITDYVIPAIK
jgi:CubicO group peptidase (beta-lactamase class C family)